MVSDRDFRTRRGGGGGAASAFSGERRRVGGGHLDRASHDHRGHAAPAREPVGEVEYAGAGYSHPPLAKGETPKKQAQKRSCTGYIVPVVAFGTGAYLTWMALASMYDSIQGPSSVLPWVSDTLNSAQGNAQAMVNIIILVVFVMAAVMLMNPFATVAEVRKLKAEIAALREDNELLRRQVDGNSDGIFHLRGMSVSSEVKLNHMVPMLKEQALAEVKRLKTSLTGLLDEEKDQSLDLRNYEIKNDINSLIRTFNLDCECENFSEAEIAEGNRALEAARRRAFAAEWEVGGAGLPDGLGEAPPFT